MRSHLLSFEWPRDIRHTPALGSARVFSPSANRWVDASVLALWRCKADQFISVADIYCAYDLAAVVYRHPSTGAVARKICSVSNTRRIDNCSHCVLLEQDPGIERGVGVATVAAASAMVLAANNGLERFATNRWECSSEYAGQDDGTELCKAAALGDIKAVSQILHTGVCVNSISDPQNRTALIAATESSSLRLIQLLVKRRARLDVRDADGYTALMWSAMRGNLPAVNHVIRSGADPFCTERDNDRTAQDHAESRGHVDIVRLLEDAKRSTFESLHRLQEFLGTQPARGIGSVFGASSNQLWIAARCADALAVRRILDARASIDRVVPHRFGSTALHAAVGQECLDAAMVLVEQNADIDARDNVRWTPLMWASRSGNSLAVKLLADARADLTAKNGKGDTAVKIARQENNAGIVVELLNSRRSSWPRHQ